MIKRLLVAIDGSEHAQTACEYALWLAERLDATVIGFHVVDVVSIEGSFFHDISGSLGFEPYLDFSSKMRDALHDRGRILLEGFETACQKRGVRVDTQLRTGIVANEICESARIVDLVVIGHRGLNEKFSTGLLGGTTESVTRKCPRPVLVSPKEFKPVANPLLAYDGSERASAAMLIAAELAAVLGVPLTVMNVGRSEEGAGEILAEARRYLDSYKVEARYKAASGYANEKIVEAISGGSHDLLFIGAYGHSRIIEMVLGSTTEYVLRKTSIPVLLAR